MATSPSPLYNCVTILTNIKYIQAHHHPWCYHKSNYHTHLVLLGTGGKKHLRKIVFLYFCNCVFLHLSISTVIITPTLCFSGVGEQTLEKPGLGRVQGPGLTIKIALSTSYHHHRITIHHPQNSEEEKHCHHYHLGNLAPN